MLVLLAFEANNNGTIILIVACRIVGYVCWVRYTHSGNYEARGASGDYEAQGASGGKYEDRMVIFRILAAVNGFSGISWKEESR